MRRLVLVVTGVLLAFLAGCCFLASALLVEALAAPAATGMALVNVAALVVASVNEGDPVRLLGVGMTAIWAALLAVCLAPIGLVAVVGEVVGARTLVFSAGASGAVTAAMPTVLRAARDMPVAPIAGEGRPTLILFLTGLATGLVYWLLAGRNAGAHE